MKNRQTSSCRAHCGRSGDLYILPLKDANDFSSETFAFIRRISFQCRLILDCKNSILVNVGDCTSAKRFLEFLPLISSRRGNLYLHFKVPFVYLCTGLRYICHCKFIPLELVALLSPKLKVVKMDCYYNRLQIQMISRFVVKFCIFTENIRALISMSAFTKNVLEIIEYFTI